MARNVKHSRNTRLTSERKKIMKSKLSLFTILGLVACCWAGFAQNNETAPSGANNPSGDAVKAATAPDAPATAPATAAESPAATLVAANDPPKADANTPAANPSAQNGAVIPLIVMDDVPLTDAFKNLARQAGLNYMLDPKISFGQPGPNGVPTPQPSVSIRWENVTAEQALNALLNNYSLQLVEDPKTKIARVTIKDPAAPDPLVTKIIQLKYAPATNILVSVQTALTDKRSKVVADVRTSQLVVVATEKEIDEVDRRSEERR